ncbi:sulfate ABC transporter permease [Vibrio sp. T187]|uniref:sulfate ABC transporter permease n=1 Tax=Vibrio TaxID=662 RepID=UPI0010C981DB|nr:MULTISPECIES: sulfate ABC transporter permease [Vibrio]MBW3695961.1 sulfate ABC transporter permease [Vibrio sp. T187]
MKKYFLLLLATISPVSLAAFQLTDDIRLSGFGTQTAVVTDQSIPVFYHSNFTDEWCYDCDTTLGVQLDWMMGGNFRSSVQVVKSPKNTYSDPDLEWAYVAYQYADTTTKIGRLRLPLFMVSEYYYVSEAYPWIRPPQDVYDSIFGLTYFDGISVDWNTWIGESLSLRVAPFFATPSTSTHERYGFSFDIEADKTLGFTADLNNEHGLIRMSYIHSSYVQDIHGGPKVNDQLNMFSIGGQYLWGNVNLMSEFVFSNELHSNWYFSMNYLFNEWTPYITYGQRRKLDDNESLIIGAKYSIIANLSAYLEWQHVWGREEPNSGHFSEPQNPLNGIETEVNVYSIGLSFTF